MRKVREFFFDNESDCLEAAEEMRAEFDDHNTHESGWTYDFYYKKWVAITDEMDSSGSGTAARICKECGGTERNPT